MGYQFKVGERVRRKKNSSLESIYDVSPMYKVEKNTAALEFSYGGFADLCDKYDLNRIFNEGYSLKNGTFIPPLIRTEYDLIPITKFHVDKIKKINLSKVEDIALVQLLKALVWAYENCKDPVLQMT